MILFLTKNHFVYANVPYRNKSYDYRSIYKDPKNTIDFNYENEAVIQHRERAFKGMDADGALLKNSQEHQMHQGKLLLEKILATLLAKLSNFIPGAGIWMNTQRPEWNDANNALSW